MNDQGQLLYARARTLIPGGTQLLSKRPEMFLPDQWPSYFSKALGAEVWDLDGNRYLDFSHCGVGACILGYGDPDVTTAIHQVLDAGTMSVLNNPEEVALAELLVELHPWADMVRFTRSGGEALTVAVRIARAASGKDKVAFSGYHGWHDWYLAANLGADSALDGHLLPGLNPKGVPRGLQGTALPFRYNHLEDLMTIIHENPGQIGVIVIEAIRGDRPEPSFLQGVRSLADQIGAVLIVDEVTSGFRLNNGGAHLLFDLVPDIAVFAKAISSGFPMAAVIGRRQVMEAAQDTFISSTHWTDRVGPVAALATIRKFIRQNVSQHLSQIGQLIQEGWDKAASETGLQIHVGGIRPLSHFSFDYPNAQAVRTLFTKLMLERGFLAVPSVYVMYAHQSEQVEAYIQTISEVFQLLANAIKDGVVEEQIDGPIAHTGFTRLTS